MKFEGRLAHGILDLEGMAKRFLETISSDELTINNPNEEDEVVKLPIAAELRGI